ncbi:WbqC family protein [Vibrio sp. 10N.261.52.F3]|uniref:WbqC family protein n=1 Tax=Vibrio sp. 10N.261.52.F3 TaxID=3229683 RepID=UPI00354CC02D
MIKVAILQSNYIPWKGVFDMIHHVDKFVFLDDVDFTKRDWRTRNKIKTPNGELWLTVPVRKMPRGTKINEMEILNDGKWQKKHYSSLKGAYSKAKYFHEFEWILDEIYINNIWCNLSEFNIHVTKLISKVLGIDTEFICSSDLSVSGSKDDRLINICKAVGADFYLSGPSAKDYIDNEKFDKSNITLNYINYDYEEYEQLHGEFSHYVTILDVLFHCGDKSKNYCLNFGVDK